MKMRTLPKLVLLLALAIPALPVSAQNPGRISGEIDEVMLDDGYIVIDGKRLVVRAGDLVITYKGEPFRATFLSQGQTIMYETRDDGSVSEITLIGPSSELDQIRNQ
jgi:c-di-GMP-binding flagellar brake protein YcgR